MSYKLTVIVTDLVCIKHGTNKIWTF